ncbi:restriction endonuclease subunit S [Escherichia coli]|nr:restriction endonuclease subunit S [Escherichia coli]
MVPKGWITKALELTGVKVIDGDRGKEYPKASDFSGDGYCLFLSAKNVTKYGFQFNELQFIDAEKDKKLRKGRVKRSNIVLTTRGSVGHFAYYDASVPYDVMRINSGMVILDADESDLEPNFLYALCRSFIVQKQIEAASFGSAQPQLTVGIVKGLKLPIPTLVEQKKIAQILSTWDKAISVTEKLLTNSQRQKKALMQQLLTGNKRLLDENGVRFSGEWKITKLIQMGKVVSGGTPDTNMAMYWEGDILWLTPTDVTALTGRFVSNTSRKITPAGLLNSSAVLLPKGSLMVCTRATIGALAISTSEICTNQGFKNIIPNEGFNIEFIYYLLQMNTNEMIKKSSGSTFLELSKKDFETLSFSCPFIKEQQKIAAVLSAADTEISTLEKKLACLKDEKKALMQQLLTGKRRVKVDEAVAV